MEFHFNAETGDRLIVSVESLHPGASYITAHFLDSNNYAHLKQSEVTGKDMIMSLETARTLTPEILSTSFIVPNSGVWHIVFSGHAGQKISAEKADKLRQD